MADGVLGPVMSRNLLAINRAQSVVDRATLRLSTQKRVNSALDNPQNFFASRALYNRASDLMRLLDGIERNISTIKTALNAVEALQTLLNQADSIATESQQMLSAGEADPDIYEVQVDKSPTPLSVQILRDNPVAFWRLNDTGGGTAVNLGSGGAALDGSYVGGVTLGGPELYANGAATSATFDGGNDRVNIPNSGLLNLGNHALRTVELVFNAATVAGRQVLYEEGGNVNSINVYIDNGQIYFNAFDNGDFGPFSITAPVVAGQTYHATIVFDFSGAGTLSGYLDGQLVGSGAVTRALSAHSGGIAIGSLNGASYMHDGPSPNNTYRFNGSIADVAVYNTALDAATIQSHADAMNKAYITEYHHSRFDSVMAQIDALVGDAQFRGQNLLAGNDILTDFNESRTSSLLTTGLSLTSDGLDVIRNDFNNESDLEQVIESVRSALETVREYGASLVNDLTIIETRADFTRELNNVLEEGGRNLVIADMNKESAILLAAQTRLSLSVTALNVAATANTNILNIFQ